MHSNERSSTAEHARRIAWWQHARFGMFIHWGLYSSTNHDCHTMYAMGIPVTEYVQRYEHQFTAARFDPDAWMSLARRAGCRYVVMGSRHHEGYCLWDTDTTSFSSVRGTPKRDLVREYLAAARRAKLRVGLYYSLLDWRHHAYWVGPRKDPRGWQRLVSYAHEQVRELMTRYGKLDILWYDGAWADPAWGFVPTPSQYVEFWQSRKLNTMVRRLQPDILLNDRTYLPEDFGTPEKELRPENRPWELCDPLAHYWGASNADALRKTPDEVISRLLFCISRGGNMLLNVGPDPDGTVASWQRRTMEAVGRWVHRHPQGIYGCQGEWAMPFGLTLVPWSTTRRGNDLFVHLLRHPGRRFGVAELHDYRFLSARLLDTGQTLRLTQEPTRCIIDGLPARAPDPIASVVKIRFRPKTAAERRARKFIGLTVPEV